MTKLKNSLKTAYWTGSLIALNAISPAVFAMTKPTDVNGLGYFIYDVAVDKIANGAIGFVIAMFVIVYSAMHLIKNWMLSIMGIIGGTILIKADQIVVSMGALVS